MTYIPFSPASSGSGYIPFGGTSSNAEPAINWSPLTPIKGFFTGLGRMAQGLTALGASAVHDVLEVGAEVLPGHQAIEDDGYRLAAIGRAFIPSLASDYAKRYGGLSNIARGLWTDPLSYISDALMVGGAVGLAAKVGRAGSVLGKVPFELMGDTAAAKILGAGAESAWKGTMELGNMSLSAGKVDLLKLSRNPATRFLQTKAAEAFSLPPVMDKMEFLAGMENPAYVHATGVINYASRNGIRVLKPAVGKFLAGQRTAHILSSLKVISQDLGKSETARIQAGLDRASDPLIASAYARGNATPIMPGKFDPIPIDTPSTDLLPTATRMSPNATAEIPGDPSALSHVASYPDRSPVVEAGPGADIPFDLSHEFGTDWFHTDLNTPHDPSHLAETGDILTRGQTHTYTVLLDSWDDLDRTVDRTLGATKTKPIGVHNYMMDDSYSYDGYHVIAQADDGAIADFSFATKDLLEAQKGHSSVMEFSAARADEMTDLQGQMADNVAAAAQAGSEVEQLALKNDGLRIASEVKDVTYEIESADIMARDMFRAHRYAYWGDNGTVIDQDLLAAEALRPILFDTINKRYWEGTPRAASIHMERAYAEQRYAKFMGMLSDSRESFKSIFAGNKMDVTDDLARSLLDSGLPEPVVNELIGGHRWWSGGDAAKVTRRADAFARRMKNTLRDNMVVEGGRSIDGAFPAYDWRVMHAERVQQGLPLPNYFPHFPNDQATKAMTVSPKGMVPRAPGITKGWTGMLLEEGRVLDDPAQAYQRAAAIMVNHQEASQTLGNLMDNVGREVSPAEVAAWRGNQYSGEVLVPLEQAQHLLSRRAELMGDTLNGLAEGDDITTATLKAVEALQERALTEGLNAIAGSRVYAVSRAVMKQFEKDLHVRFGHAMRMYWDGPMNLWKASVLSLSPRWVVNNLFGNQFFMGLENPGAMRLGLEQMDKTTAHLTEQLFGAYATSARRGFFSDAQRIGSSLPEGETGFLGKLRSIEQSRATAPLSTISGKITHLNQFVEQADRRGVLVNEVMRRVLPEWVQGFHSSESILKRAFSEGKLTPEVMAEALKGVDKTLGNFTQFGVYEQAILKRFLVPFWGFYRHSAKVLLRLPFEHPLKGAVLKNIAAVDAVMHEGEPDWLRSRFKLMDMGGKDLMVNIQNLNPLSQFSEQFTQGQSVVSVLNPIVKMVLERQLGIDTYTGEPFRTDDKNIIKTYNGAYYEIMYDTQGNYIGTKQLDGPPVPGLIAHIAQQFPQLSMIPAFQRYPKNMLLQFASIIGLPLSEIDVEGTVAQQASAQADAESIAENRIAEQGASSSGYIPFGS